jgi:hypothetical protein
VHRLSQTRLTILSGLALLLAMVPLSLVAWHAQRQERAARVCAVRQDLARMVDALDTAVHGRGPRTRAELAQLLERARQSGGGRIAWIQIRHGGGTVIAHAGLPPTPAFRPDTVRAQLRDGRPLFRTVKTPEGAAVVEAFAFDLPVAVVPLAGGVLSSGVGVIEVAIFLNPRAAAGATSAPVSTPAPAVAYPA